MAGFDPKDSTSLARPVPILGRRSVRRSQGQEDRHSQEYRVDGLGADVARVWDGGIAWLKDAGAEIVEVSLPHSKYALPGLLYHRSGGSLVNLARDDGVRYGLRDLPGRREPAGYVCAQRVQRASAPR